MAIDNRSVGSPLGRRVGKGAVVYVIRKATGEQVRVVTMGTGAIDPYGPLEVLAKKVMPDGLIVQRMR
jgi:hypothetical protein